MSNYIICTDSGCDLKPATLAEWGIPYSPLTFRFNDSEKEYTDADMEIKEFYDKMRNGGIAKTAAINSETFSAEFEKHLSAGLDVLYIGFSSGLSTTYNSGRLAAQAMREKYPERKIITVDSLAASAGEGLYVALILKKKNEGATIEEAAAYAEEIKLNICHWFTVDDLVYLKRGGRVSPTVAFVGNALGIKPILHVDNEGHLISKAKVRGRKSSITALADKYTELAVEPEGGLAYISNGDCEDDANALKKILEDRHNAKIEIITNVGPVIGAHSGPGTLALFFVGKER